jgi:hypothetical protein
VDPILLADFQQNRSVFYTMLLMGTPCRPAWGDGQEIFPRDWSNETPNNAFCVLSAVIDLRYDREIYSVSSVVQVFFRPYVR